MSSDARHFETDSVEATLALGRDLAGELSRGDLLCLNGPLGAGKTVLTRGLAEGLGIEDVRLVSSPTYVLVHEYPCTPPLYHLDLYRMVAPAEELENLGLEEMLADGVVLIEWAARAGDALPAPRLEMDIELTGPESRAMTLRRIEGAG